MTIFQLEPNGKTNTAKYVSNIVGENVRVLTSNNNKYDRNVSIPVFGKYGESGSLGKLIYYSIGLAKILFSIPSRSIIHYHWLKLSPLDFLVLWALKRKSIKIVGTVHNILPHEERMWDKYFFKKIYAISDHLIFHSNSSHSNFEQLFSSPNDYTIIEHYIDPVIIEHEKEVSNQILFFGNIRPYKGLEILLQAVRNLPSDLRWKLIIAGKPEYNIERLVKDHKQELNIEWHLEFISKETMADLFNQSAIVVLPYLKIDTSGLFYLAKSYGKITITPKLDFFNENIEHQVDGLLFEKGNSCDLGFQIEYALKNENYLKLKKNISQRIPVDSVDHFKIEHFELYKRLLND